MISISTVRLFFPGLVAALLLTACASMPDLPLAPDRNVEDHELVATITPGFTPYKAAYDPFSGNLFVMDQPSQKVSIFKGERLVNVVGGFGFETSNFQRLSDIELENDGSLLCLDTMAKAVKRFTAEGAFVSEISLSGVAQPTSFCVAPDQTMFVFDSATGEIICLSALDHTEQYRFGRFQLTGLTSMSATRDYLLTFAKETNTSSLYSVLGQQLQEYDGFWVMDAYKQFFTTELIRSGRSPQLSWNLLSGQVRGPIDTLHHLNMHQGCLTIARGDYVLIYRLVYGAGQ